MTELIQFTVNGKPQRISTDPQRNLLETLREELGLTGTKYGCGEGQCRACTVLVDGKPIQSCLTPLSAVKDRKVETIEGLGSEGQLHPIQKAFVEEEGMQCGYCVPGMIMTTVGLLRRNASPTKAEILDAVNGNICRCCGYGNLLKAVERAASAKGGPR